ncbi:MAG: hypothetical protein ACKODS_01915, partial [Methylophilaceae bacterium]
MYHTIVLKMGKLNVLIKKDHRDKNGECPLLVEYSHRFTRARINTKIKVNPDIFRISFDEHTNLYMLASGATLNGKEQDLFRNANRVLLEVQ